MFAIVRFDDKRKKNAKHFQNPHHKCNSKIVRIYCYSSNKCQLKMQNDFLFYLYKFIHAGRILKKNTASSESHTIEMLLIRLIRTTAN